MQKETLKNVREIATVTAVGAAEGAAIGFAAGMGFLSLQGYAAGGIIGGLTALTTELVGRSKKEDITVKYTIHKKGSESSTHSKLLPNLYMIQIADKSIQLTWELIRRASPRADVEQIELELTSKKTLKDGTTVTRNKYTVLDKPFGK